MNSTMLIGQKQEKTRKGVQIPFLESLLEKEQDESTITEITKAIEYSKNTEYFRHPNIPRPIPDEHVWNDCWYDEPRKAWITLNQHFMSFPNAMDRDIQKKYLLDSIANPGVIIEEERIEFRMGLPSFLTKDDKGIPTWYAWPTLYDVMLTKEIVKGMLKPETQEEGYLYTVGSDAYISILGRYLTEAEYEFAKEFMIGMVKEPLEVVRATSGRPYDEKLYKKQLKQMEKETKEWEKQQRKKKD